MLMPVSMVEPRWGAWAGQIACSLTAAFVLLDSPSAAQSPEAAGGVPREVVQIAPGMVWPAVEAPPPGTMIELAGPGVHLPAVLDGLRGTKDRPIVVRRSVGGTTAPFVVGGETGLLIRDCEHLLVEEIAFIGATRRAVRIENCRNIAVRNVLVARLGPDADADGIEIADSTEIELRTIRFDGWQDAGLELTGVSGFGGSDLQFTPLTRHRNRTAIRVGAGCRDVRLSEFSTRSIPVAVDIGTPVASDLTPPNARPETAPRSPRGVVVERARLDRPEIAVRLADAEDVQLRRLTITNPGTVFEIEAAELRSARFSENLMVWDPGSMKAFAKVIRGDEDLELGTNLWWSAELPAALPLLGDFPGRTSAPQRFSPDPRLAPQGHPTADGARGLGRPAPGES